jgi:hypothetical protein
MKSKYFFIALSLVLSSALSVLSAQNSMGLGEFQELTTSGNVEVTLIPSSANKVEYTMVKGDKEDLIIELKNNKLKISITNDKIMGRSNAKAKVSLYFKELDNISTSAGSSVSSDSRFNTKNLYLSSSSGSRLKVSVKAEMVTVSSSSGASLYIAGEAVKSIMKVSSGATISSQAFTTDELVASASSGGNISADVHQSITANSSSGGSISYSGNPKVEKISKSTSGGSIRKM